MTLRLRPEPGVGARRCKVSYTERRKRESGVDKPACLMSNKMFAIPTKRRAAGNEVGCCDGSGGSEDDSESEAETHASALLDGERLQ